MSHSKKEIPSNFTALEITESHPWFSELGSKDTLVDRFAYINNVLLSKFQRPETFGMFFKENQTNRQNIQRQFKTLQIDNEPNHLSLACFQNKPNLWWITSVDTQGKITLAYNSSMFGITSKEDNLTAEAILTALFSSDPKLDEKLSSFKGISKENEIDEIKDIALRQLIISFNNEESFKKWRQKNCCLNYVNDPFVKERANNKLAEKNLTEYEFKKLIILCDFDQANYDLFDKLVGEIYNIIILDIKIRINKLECELTLPPKESFPIFQLFFATCALTGLAMSIALSMLLLHQCAPACISFLAFFSLASLICTPPFIHDIFTYGNSVYWRPKITTLINTCDEQIQKTKVTIDEKIDSLINLLTLNDLEANHTHKSTLSLADNKL